MTIDQLIYFVDVCENKSFTKTGKKYYVSQPAISSTIKKLEEELGTELFIRSNNTIEVTDSGEYLYSLSKPLIDLFSNLPKQMEDYLFKNSCVKAGVPPMLGAFIFAPIFEKFYVKYPQINLKLTELCSKANQEAVLRGDVDVALTVIYQKAINEALAYKKIGETHLVFAVRKNHPFAKKKNISIQEIATIPLLLLKEDSLQYEIVTNAFKKHNLTPDIRLLTDQIATIKELLSYGNIGAFLFDQIIKENDDIVGIPLDQNIVFDVVIATAKNKTIQKPVQIFYDFIVNCFSPSKY